MKLFTILLLATLSVQVFSAALPDAMMMSMPSLMPITDPNSLSEPAQLADLTAPEEMMISADLKADLRRPSPCPQWNPTPTRNSNASFFPNLILQSYPGTARDGICQKTISQDCAQYTKFARGDNIFAYTLKRNLDFTYYGGRIIAYRIRWFNGSWSRWFVPGVNDIGPKYWTVGGVKHLMRWWAYFSDHTHTFILCK